MAKFKPRRYLFTATGYRASGLVLRPTQAIAVFTLRMTGLTPETDIRSILKSPFCVGSPVRDDIAQVRVYLVRRTITAAGEPQQIHVLDRQPVLAKDLRSLASRP